jgi:hypothetical protein
MARTGCGRNSGSPASASRTQAAARISSFMPVAD